MKNIIEIPSLSDFMKADIKNIIKDSPLPVCEEYAILLEKSAEQTATTRFLHSICSLSYKITNRTYLKNNETIDFELISTDEASLISKYIPYIFDSDIKARVADIVWPKIKNGTRISTAHIAINAYINSAKKLSKYDKFYAIQRLLRAADIALKIKKFNRKSTVWRALLNWIQNEINPNPQDDDIDILDFVLHKKVGNTKHIIKKCIYISYIFRAQQNYAGEQDLLQTIIKNISKLPWKTDSLLNYLQNRMLSSIEEQAKSYSPIGAAVHLKRAISKAREYKLSEETIRLHKILLHIQKNIENEMEAVKFSLDTTPIISKIDSEISGKEVHEAMHSLASIIPILYEEKQKTFIINIYKKNLFSSILSLDIVNPKGKTIATLHPLKFDGSQEDIKNITDRVFHHIASFQAPVYGKLIKYALEKIASEHSKEEISNEIEIILNNNYFIPEDHFDFFKNGLLHGIYDDIVTANSLIVPQLENSIRHYLELGGYITSNLSNRQIQAEQDLNKLLNSDDVIKILSSDICFTLRSIFTEKTGLNFRNNIAHGLLTYADQSSSSAYYAWGIIFKIIFLFSRLKSKNCQ